MTAAAAKRDLLLLALLALLLFAPGIASRELWNPDEPRYAEVAREERTVVCFESGRRLAASLADLAVAMPDRLVVVAREVSKVFEDFVRGAAAELAARAGDLVARGEVTLFIAPSTGAAPAMSEDALRAEVARRRASGLHLKEIARALAAETGWPAREIYRLGLDADEDA